MTVKDLIEVLSQADPTWEVRAHVIVTESGGAKGRSEREIVDVHESRDRVIIQTD